MQSGVLQLASSRRRVREGLKQRMITSLVLAAGAAAERFAADHRAQLDTDPYDSGR